MTIEVGTHLPEATLLRAGPEGAESISLADRLKDRDYRFAWSR